MANLFRKQRLLFTAADGLIVLIFVIILSSCAQNGISTTPINTSNSNQELSTPELIDQALARSEISEEERLLYLAYAIFEYESLPTRFHSKVGWRGTAVIEELNEAVGSPAILCSMSPYVQSELLRLIKLNTTCS
jgi:hypothetical protein